MTQSTRGRMVWTIWGGRWDSNPRRPDPQSGALPTELRPPSAHYKPQVEHGAPGRTRTCNPRLSLPTTAFAALHLQVCGLDYLFAISGAARIVSTDPLGTVGSLVPAEEIDRRFPRDCHQRDLLRVPRYSAVHCIGSVSRYRLLTQRPMLYPVELRALSYVQLPPGKIIEIGRGRRIRTADLLLPKQMRYQTAPCPENLARHLNGPHVRLHLRWRRRWPIAAAIAQQHCNISAWHPIAIPLPAMPDRAPAQPRSNR